jgi:hypothetical protein
MVVTSRFVDSLWPGCILKSEKEEGKQNFEAKKRIFKPQISSITQKRTGKS